MQINLNCSLIIILNKINEIQMINPFIVGQLSTGPYCDKYYIQFNLLFFLKQKCLDPIVSLLYYTV